VKLGALGEFNLIKRIRQRAAATPQVLRGIGDDAAELVLPPGEHLLTSTDLLLEQVHFRFDWTDAKCLGRKAVAVNLSDLAAMGGRPRFLYLGLACPGHTELTQVEHFLEGVLQETAAYDVALVGGDTCHSPGPWMISVTVEGSVLAGQAIGRDGARPGDRIMVSGSLGDSALALYQLERAITPVPELLQRHCTPTARVELGMLLGGSGLISAMIDISDGLTADLEHILQASCLDALIDRESLPLSAWFRAALQGQPELVELALGGGEDYELLFTVPSDAVAAVATLGRQAGVPVTCIGELVAGTGAVRLRDVDGSVRPLLVRGYDHFCRPER
jgi:thiamine-monophosphate kinase